MGEGIPRSSRGSYRPRGPRMRRCARRRWRRPEQADCRRRWCRRHPRRPPLSQSRSHSPLWALLLAFPVALLTVLNLRPIQETFAERFLYLPVAGVTLLAALALDRAGIIWRRAALALVAVLAVLMV